MPLFLGSTVLIERSFVNRRPAGGTIKAHVNDVRRSAGLPGSLQRALPTFGARAGSSSAPAVASLAPSADPQMTVTGHPTQRCGIDIRADADDGRCQ